MTEGPRPLPQRCHRSAAGSPRALQAPPRRGDLCSLPGSVSLLKGQPRRGCAALVGFALQKPQHGPASVLQGRPRCRQQHRPAPTPQVPFPPLFFLPYVKRVL